LNFLFLTGNLFVNFDSAHFSSLGELVHLDLGFNRIDKIQNGTFDNLRSVIRLDLTSNNLTTVQAEMFKNCIELRDLVLDNNKISMLRLGRINGSSLFTWVK